MNELPTTRKELQKYIGELSEGATITICKNKDDIPITLRLVSETVTTESGATIIFLKNIQGFAVSVWVFANVLFPDYIPKPSKLIVATSTMISRFNFSFPFFQNAGKPMIQISEQLPSGEHISGASYYLPPTGVPPELLPQ